jgi:hypothetical protein
MYVLTGTVDWIRIFEELGASRLGLEDASLFVTA